MKNLFHQRHALIEALSRKAAGSFFLLLIIANTSAQNLVVNSGFESYFDCPGSYNYLQDGKLAPGWFSPTFGTPDIFNGCSVGNAGVPTNWAGFSKAYTGVGYAGVYAYVFGKQTPYREYIQAELLEPLEPGGNYLVEFYFKLSSNSKYSIDRIGILLSDSSHRNTHDGVFPIAPSYERLNRTIYNRSTGLWTRFGYTYEAKGGERFLTIGNFSSDGKTRSQFIESSQGKEPMLARAAYYYIDDVKVIKVGGVPQAPVLTGYPEIKTDENYVLKNIQFRFNDFTLLESSYPELKRLVEIMHYHKAWKVVVSGHTDDVGSDAYNLDLSLLRAGSVADYLIEQGIDPARIKTQGFGKQTPLVKGTDESSRSTNRRVELRFLN